MSKVTDPELLKQLNAGTELPRVEGGWKVGDEIDLLRGVSQGLIDPVEGIVQLAEKSTGWTLAPQGIKDWAREYRKKAQSTMLGVGGEVLGNIVPMMIPGGAVGTAANVAGRAARIAPLAERLAAAVVGGAAQPVSGGGDYWRTKAGQAVSGGIGGATLPVVAGQAAKIAPFLGHMAGHMTGLPSAALRLAQGPAIPISALAGKAARLPAGTVGAEAGMARGKNPSGNGADTSPAPAEEPASEPAAKSAAPAPPANDRSWIINRAGKGGRLDQEDGDGASQ